MNLLAHVYLSGNEDLVKIGNFVADGIRGKNYLKYPEKMQNGILLHRSIDFFTDTHAIFKQSTKRLHQTQGHYSGVVVDMFYDHFLAKNFLNYSKIPLVQFASDFYTVLESNYDILPEKTKNLIPYLTRDNWFVAYSSLEGIDKILCQMQHRTKNKGHLDKAIIDLKKDYTYFEDEFTRFFEDVQQHAIKTLQHIKANT